MIEGLSSLLREATLLDSAKARIRETKKVLTDPESQSTTMTRSKRESLTILPQISQNGIAEGSLIGKRTEREEVKDVEMADETTSITEKRLKVSDDKDIILPTTTDERRVPHSDIQNLDVIIDH